MSALGSSHADREKSTEAMTSACAQRLLGGFLLPLAAAWLVVACRMPAPLVEGLFTRTESVPVPTAFDCERCHQEVYREWETSLHARAFRHEPFQRASGGGRAPECTRCHAPGPVEAGALPALREMHRREGVTCITCHQSPDPEASALTMRGPVSRTSPIEIHPVIASDPIYRSSELCGTCHQGAYREWLAVEATSRGEKPTCQACHMPEVRRKIESVHDEHAYSALFVALGDEAALRRHTFEIPEPDAEALGLEVRTGAGGQLAVRVENRLPHALPTGDYGRREIRLRAFWPGGEVVESRSRRLGEGLPPGESWEVRIPLPPGVEPGSVRVALERFDHEAGDFRAVLEPARP